MIEIYSINNYCSQEKLVKLATKCGFFVRKGKRHVKIKDEEGKTITVIPRHNKIKVPTAKGIIEDLIQNGAEIKIVK